MGTSMPMLGSKGTLTSGKIKLPAKMSEMGDGDLVAEGKPIPQPGIQTLFLKSARDSNVSEMLGTWRVAERIGGT